MTHIQGCTNAHNDGRKLPLSQPLQAAGPERIDPSNANVWWANVVETDGAQSSGQNETVDGEVENMLRSVSAQMTSPSRRHAKMWNGSEMRQLLPYMPGALGDIITPAAPL
ncbi:hypothetical protein ILYODFUR_009404 [Ilyodon furcidens]|uniref:Uncharacterized protein n=1 Tax=Ilyodon furcidens TaxID=33524 RepID=A0ABV0V1N6_9TELE